MQCEKRSLEMWRVWRRRWFDKVRCFSLSDGEGEEDRRSGPSSSSGEELEHRGGGSDDDVRSERARASVSPRVCSVPYFLFRPVFVFSPGIFVIFLSVFEYWEFK